MKKLITINTQAFKSLLQGSFLADRRMRKHYPFLLFLVVMAILSIRSSHRADEKVHRIGELRKELKDLSSDFIETRSKLMEASTESKVLERAAAIDLYRPDHPPVELKNSADGE